MLLPPIFVLCVFSVSSSAEIDVKEKCDGTCEKQLCENEKDILTLHLQIVSQNVRIAEQNSQIERQNVDLQKQNVHIHKQNTKIELQNSKLMELRFRVDALSVTVQLLEGKGISAQSPGKQGKKCSAPPLVTNADFISSSYSVGESGTYHCTGNYAAVGVSSIVCLVNETWSSTDFHCLGPCPDPPPVSNASFAASDYSVGRNVTYECQENYVATGNPTITCLMNQEWTPTDFKCTGVCPDPPPVSNATFVSSDFSVGTNVTYECQENYVATGNPTITCLMNHEWTPTDFSCTGQCPEPPQIHRASYVSSKHEVGDSLTYRCTGNYAARGNNTITCLDNLQWTPTDFRCIGWKCYYWTPSDGNLMKKIGEHRTCTRNPRRRFTRGNDSLAPGCSHCNCCKPRD